MNRNHLLVLSVLSSMTLGLMAQTKVHGQADATAGIGTATPYGANLKLDIAGSRFSFRPYIGLTGITRQSSALDNDTHFIYSRTQNLYQSLLESESKGHDLVYGTALKFDAGLHDTFTASVDGSVRTLEIFGSQQESLKANGINKDADLSVRVRSLLHSPKADKQTLGASAAWQHRTSLPGESFNLSYQYALTMTDRELQQDVIDQEGFSRFTSNHLDADTKKYQHTVSLDWKRPLAKGHLLNLGARYDQWKIESNDLQLLDGKTTLDSHFEHKTKVAAAFVGYNLSAGPVLVNARVEYDYTRQQDRDLHDVIPSLRAQWNLSKHHSLVALYAKRLVRPEIEFLNPAHIVGAFTVDYGNPNLEGIHINMFSLAYNLKREKVGFTSTVQHIRAEDGFNAIWMEKENIRESFYGNEGVRRAWSFTPEVEWKASALTTLSLKAALLWDKRIARAISMTKEHWGITTQAKVQQQLAAGFRLDLHFDYSEGNTIDLYSHESRSMNLGAKLQRSFLADKNLVATLAYDYREYAKTVITQGAYTGCVFARPGDRNAASVSLSYKF